MTPQSGKRRPVFLAPYKIAILVFLVLIGLSWCSQRDFGPEKPKSGKSSQEPIPASRLLSTREVEEKKVGAESDAGRQASTALAGKIVPFVRGEADIQPSSGSSRPENRLPVDDSSDRRGGTVDDRVPLLPVPNNMGDPSAREEPVREIATLSRPGPINGQFVQTVNSSKGVYSDRPYTVFETSLDLRGEGLAGEIGFSWRGRYAPGEDFTGALPSSYLAESWYRYNVPQGPYRLTLGRHYIDAAVGELVDGLSVDRRADDGAALGGFVGFRPDPYDFGFRSDAFTAGVYSAWTDGSAGRSYSRQALVVNVFQWNLDRTYLSWDAGTTLADTVSLWQYLVIDFRPDDERLSLTNYSLGIEWRPLRDLWINWRGEAYRNIFYDVGSEDIPTDTSVTYASTFSLRYVFSRQMIGHASLSYTRRDLDSSDSLSGTVGLDLSNLFDSGTDLSLSYSTTDYYNAFFDLYDVQLTRRFGRRITLGLGGKYWRNIAETLVGDGSSEIYALSGNATYILNDRLDFYCSYEYQKSWLNNGSTLGLGFDRPADFIGSDDEIAGYNFTALIRWKF